MPRRPTRANKLLKHSPLEVIERAKSHGVEEVIVSFSGGKDAIVTLDLCVQHFKRVEAFFQYVVPGLSYEEEPLIWAERTYGIKIFRTPHWVLSRLFRESTFRHPTQRSREMPLVKARHVENNVRRHFGIRWIASGEKTCDSPQRNGYIRHSKGVEENRLRFYPVGYWSDTAVLSYMSLNRLPTPVQYRILSGDKQFGGFGMDSMAAVYEKFPEDFAKIRKVFPLIEAQVVRHRLKQKAKSVSEVPDADHSSVAVERG
ncbi:MAG: phosphoadenosine phosphosulfate reductase [Porticoccaceae bacterium]|nr:phosphoadenosine phosphosulfate reductase [Porticoccaceae bacterium]